MAVAVNMEMDEEGDGVEKPRSHAAEHWNKLP